MRTELAIRRKLAAMQREYDAAGSYSKNEIVNRRREDFYRGVILGLRMALNDKPRPWKIKDRDIAKSLTAC